ncbi:MAG: pilus assembly protein PilM [Candidatus Omnitrophica bacterium]|nr:pilus assembly protein PilM [Candidatus Omnitrophota bacterium]
MSSLGIYFGPKTISVVESSGRRVTKTIRILQTAVSGAELEEKVPPEAKLIEIIAIFKDELRRNDVNAKEASVCLSGKDLVIRTFELPIMPRNEMQGAVNFEAKKYIPFKVEDLITDFQAQVDKSTKENFVLFLGIKKEAFDRYVSIFKQLNIKLKSVEYSAFSLLRCLKLANLGNKGVVAVLGVDPESEDEVNFTVLENGFPLFSRDITLTSLPEEISEGQPSQPLEKLKAEIRVSLDYFQRKFPDKRPQKIYFISADEEKIPLEGLMSELGFQSQFVEIKKFLGPQAVASLGLMKGLGASLSGFIKSDIKVDLLEGEKKIGAFKRGLEPETGGIFKGIKLDIRVVILALVICAGVFAFGKYRISPVKNEIDAVINQRPKVTTVNPENSYEELFSVDLAYKNKLAALDNLLKKQLYLTQPLNVIPRLLPDGVWLRDFSFTKSEDGKVELILSASAYLGDSEEEFQAASDFSDALKNDPVFSRYFQYVNISSINTEKQDKESLTNFTIYCKGTAGKN